MLAQHKTSRFVTFGEWELGQHLPLECQREFVFLNPNMKKYLNVMHLALEVYGLEAVAKVDRVEDLASLYKIEG